MSQDQLVGVIAEKTVKGRPVRVVLVLEPGTLRPHVSAKSGSILLARYTTSEPFRKLAVLGQPVLTPEEFRELETALGRASDQYADWRAQQAGRASSRADSWVNHRGVL